MIYSMTAYSKHEIKNKWGIATWEMRSVNQRYLDIHFRLPEHFRSLEPILYGRIRSRLTRGKVECYLNFNLDSNIQGELVLNKNLVMQLSNAANWIKMQIDGDKINPFDILCWPGVIITQKYDLDTINMEIFNAFDILLDDFVISRETGGKEIKKIIENRLSGLSMEIEKIRAHMPEILKCQKENLVDKLKNAEISFDRNRLEQEYILIAHRIDISEEIDRLEAHVKETYKILNRNEAVGRRLDFILQEFNRESNTLAAKSINLDITNSAIEIKVLIEQMREHTQNIE